MIYSGTNNYSAWLFRVTDESIKECEVLRLDSNSENIFIPNQVTLSLEGESTEVYRVVGLGEHCLQFSTIKHLEISEGIKYIGEYALHACTNLEELRLPSTIETLGDNALAGCTSLAFEDVPNFIKHIGPNAFHGTQLHNANLTDNVISLGSDAFSNTPIKSLTIPTGIRIVPDGLCSGCHNLTFVYLNSDIVEIARDAFNSCLSLENIDLPVSLKKIGGSSFSNTPLNELELPESLESIGSGAFHYCFNLPEKIHIPKSVTKIGDNKGLAFSQCHSIAEFEVDSDNQRYCSIDGILYSKDRTQLIQCPENNQIQILHLPDEVSTICSDACSGNKSIKEIILPKGLSNIWDSSLCIEGLEKITSYNDVPPDAKSYFNIYSFCLTSVYENANLYVPLGSEFSYSQANGWNRFKHVYTTSSVDSITETPIYETGRYNILGKEVDTNYKGIVIILFNNGSIKKTLTE